ncbi:MAG: hypothetical protein V7K26_14400 [Nostoc sp.]
MKKPYPLVKSITKQLDAPHSIGGWGFLSNPETDSQRRYQRTSKVRSAM